MFTTNYMYVTATAECITVKGISHGVVVWRSQCWEVIEQEQICAYEGTRPDEPETTTGFMLAITREGNYGHMCQLSCYSH